MVDSLHTSEIPVGGALIKVSLNWKLDFFKIAVLRRNKLQKLLCFVIANNLQFSILSKFSFANFEKNPNCWKISLWKLKYFPGFKKKLRNNNNLHLYTVFCRSNSNLHGNNPFSYFGSFDCIILIQSCVSMIFSYQYSNLNLLCTVWQK